MSTLRPLEGARIHRPAAGPAEAAPAREPILRLAEPPVRPEPALALLLEHRERFGLPEDAEWSADSSYRCDDGTWRVGCSYTEPVPLGPEFGPWAGSFVDVPGGVRMTFDEEGALADLEHEAPNRRAALQALPGLIERGQVRPENDPPFKSTPEGPRPYAAEVYRDDQGRRRIRRIPVATAVPHGFANAAGLARMLAAPGAMAVPPLWTGSAGFVPFAGPADTPEGTVVAGRPDGRVAGVDPATGAERWSLSLGDLAGAPVTTEAGNALVATRDGRVVCVSPEGSARWEAAVADRLDEGPLPAPGGRLLVRTPKGALHSLSEADGREIWRQQVGGGFERSPRPAVGPDGTVFVVTYSRTSPGHLHALGAEDGLPRWSTGLSATPASLAADDAGRLLVGYTVGRLSAFEGETGTFLWHGDAGGRDSQASVRPVAGPDGAVFAATDAGRVYGLEADGSPRWAREVAAGEASRLSAPVSGPEGEMLVADPGGRVHAVDTATGLVQWRTDLEAPSPLPRSGTPASPPETVGSRVLTTDREGRMRAVSPRLTLEEMAREAPPDVAADIRQEAGQVVIGGISLPING